jgi:hypothetical protein
LVKPCRRSAALAALFVLFAGQAAAGAPERKVQNNHVISDRLPRVDIAVPTAFAYEGADRWNLYENADCEIHVFADTGPDHAVRRLIWVQFEGYLPEKPDARYRYNSPQHATLGGLDFFVDTYPRRAADAVRAGSDREHMQALLAAHGAHLADGMMYVRFVHLLDDRRELMIIYGEPLPDQSLTTADLSAGGKAADSWPALSNDLINRAMLAVTLR